MVGTDWVHAEDRLARALGDVPGSRKFWLLALCPQRCLCDDCLDSGAGFLSVNGSRWLALGSLGRAAGQLCADTDGCCAVTSHYPWETDRHSTSRMLQPLLKPWSVCRLAWVSPFVHWDSFLGGTIPRVT